MGYVFSSEDLRARPIEERRELLLRGIPLVVLVPTRAEILLDEELSIRLEISDRPLALLSKNHVLAEVLQVELVDGLGVRIQTGIQQGGQRGWRLEERRADPPGARRGFGRCRRDVFRGRIRQRRKQTHDGPARPGE